MANIRVHKDSSTFPKGRPTIDVRCWMETAAGKTFFGKVKVAVSPELYDLPEDELAKFDDGFPESVMASMLYHLHGAPKTKENVEAVFLLTELIRDGWWTVKSAIEAKKIGISVIV